VAIVCSSDSGNSVNWFLPLNGFLEQEITNADKRKKEEMIRIITGVFL